MSAQDDVLSAFGDATEKTPTEATELDETVEADETPAAEAAIDDSSVAEEQDGGGKAEAGEGEQTAKLSPEAGAGEQEPELSHASAPEDQTGGAARSQTSAPEEQTGRGQTEAGEGEKEPELSHALASEDQAGGAAPSQTSAPEAQTGGGQTEVAAAELVSEPAHSPQPEAQPAVFAEPTAQPYLDPAAFFAQLQAEAAPKAKRRWPRLLLRYASAVVVAGAVGAGTAYAVTVPRRTDVPFLATPSDGRYTFPVMVRPAPPSGEPAPGADSNAAQAHYDDLRQYLVSAPVGVVPKEEGWESVADFDSSLTGTNVRNSLYDAGIERVARRGWTASDGQHTVVELLQFPDHQAAYAVVDALDIAVPVKASKAEGVVPELTVPSFGGVTSTVAVHKFDAVDGLAGQVERRVVFRTGDVVAIVTTTAPAGVADTATDQVVLLEAQMLL